MKNCPVLPEMPAAETVIPIVIAPIAKASGISRLEAYWALSKPRVTMLVWFSMLLGMAYGSLHGANPLLILSASVGTWLIIAAANGLNQVLEANEDAQMLRTKLRPIASGQISRMEGAVVCAIWAILSALILWFGANPLTAILGVTALVVYVFAYTPMKKISPWCIVPGAIAGAMPPVMGWTAMRGVLGWETLGFFLVQFIWQFPHTWSIAWLNRDDYAKVKFFMLPANDTKGKVTGWFMSVLSFALLIVSLYPLALGQLNFVYGVFGSGLGIWMFISCVRFTKDPSRENARKALLTSVAYLPLIMLLLIFAR